MCEDRGPAAGDKGGKAFEDEGSFEDEESVAESILHVEPLTVAGSSSQAEQSLLSDDEAVTGDDPLEPVVELKPPVADGTPKPVFPWRGPLIVL